MEQNFEFSPIWANLERQNFWNPDAIRTKSDKIWLPLSGHKWLAAIRVPHLYSGVLIHRARASISTTSSESITSKKPLRLEDPKPIIIAKEPREVSYPMKSLLHPFFQRELGGQSFSVIAWRRGCRVLAAATHETRGENRPWKDG
jgi:hypothetical protein